MRFGKAWFSLVPLKFFVFFYHAIVPLGAYESRVLIVANVVIYSVLHLLVF